jgi:Na+-driven multidrug efflux pump
MTERMHDKLNDFIGAVLGASGSSLLGAITWERAYETAVYSAIGAVVCGFAGGCIGFFLPRVLKQIFSDKKGNRK